MSREDFWNSTLIELTLKFEGAFPERRKPNLDGLEKSMEELERKANGG
jgi:hypothetical protein